MPSGRRSVSRPGRAWITFLRLVVGALTLICLPRFGFAFEGRITATLTERGHAEHLGYTVGTNFLVVAQLATDWPSARNVVNLHSGEITLLFPHNRSFIRLRNGGPANRSGTNGWAQSMQPTAGSRSAAQFPPVQPVELEATGEKTNLLGYACVRYEIKQRGELMEIWATDRLLPFQPYLQNQPPPPGPQMLEEQWGELLRAKKLFPLLAILKLEDGSERLRFEVASAKPEKIEDQGSSFFQPPPGYHEIELPPE